MFEVDIDNRLVLHAKTKAESARGKRYIGNDQGTAAVAGFAAEEKVRELFGYPLSTITDRPDGGVDLYLYSVAFDVKTVVSNWVPRPHYANNIPAYQFDYDTIAEAYIFGRVTHNADRMWITGWLSKKEFVKRAVFYPEGTERKRDDGKMTVVTASMYEIPNSQIWEVDSLAALFTQIESWSHY